MCIYTSKYIHICKDIYILMSYMDIYILMSYMDIYILMRSSVYHNKSAGGQ